jgi:hypothetical protein
MKISELFVLLALLLSLTGVALYAAQPSNNPPDLGLAVIAVAGVFAIGAGAWAISEREP